MVVIFRYICRGKRIFFHRLIPGFPPLAIQAQITTFLRFFHHIRTSLFINALAPLTFDEKHAILINVNTCISHTNHM